MTTSIPGAPLPSHVELDLDSRTERSPERSGHRRLMIIVALVLAGGGLGVGLASLNSPPAPSAQPEAEIALLESHLDGVPVATLRLTVHNPNPGQLVVTGVDADGVRSNRVHIAVTRNIPAGATVAIDVTVKPDCRRSLDSKPLTTRLTLAGGHSAPVLSPPSLLSAGGLCRQVRADIPSGWPDPLVGGQARRAGRDLWVQLPNVPPSTRVAGVWAGELLLGTRAPIQVVDGVVAPFLLALPPACTLPQDAASAPTGIRLLLIDEDGLRERYAPLGPVLAGWLLQACA